MNYSKTSKAPTESLLVEKLNTAIKGEFDSIGQQQVFRDFKELLEERKAVPSRWVYIIKSDWAGSVQRFKTVPVSGRNQQIKGMNYQATHTLTARLVNDRLALAVTAKYNIKIQQTDVHTAFLRVYFKEVIEMHPLQGYYHIPLNGRWYNDQKSNNSHNIISCLRKFLHGLKQSAHILYGTVKDFVISIGFVSSWVDRGLFVCQDNENHGIVVATVIL